MNPLNKMCWGKHRFPSEDAALKFASTAWTPFPLRAYACPNLEPDGSAHYHLTKKPGEGRWVQPDLSARPRRVERAMKRRGRGRV